MPSPYQWLAVTVTVSTVVTGCSSTNQRHRLELAITAPSPTINAQATWTDGMAAAVGEPAPAPPVHRLLVHEPGVHEAQLGEHAGGAIGMACTNRHAIVVRARVLRIRP